jgi:hypothetical protein
MAKNCDPTLPHHDNHSQKMASELAHRSIPANLWIYSDLTGGNVHGRTRLVPQGANEYAEPQTCSAFINATATNAATVLARGKNGSILLALAPL